MSIALKGFLTGVFQGIGEAMDEERKQTKELLATRTKNSYQNYLKHQEQVEALKTEIKKRDAEAISFQPDLSEQERAVLATTPNLLELYKKAVSEGRSVEGRGITLRDLIQVGPKASGMTVENILQSAGVVQPLDAVSVGKGRPFIGVSEENQRRYLSQLSGSIGIAPEQLMAFEKPPEAPSVTPLGSIKTDVAFKPVFESPEEQLKTLQNMIVQAELADNKEAANNARVKLGTLEAVLSTFTPEQRSWSDQRNKLQSIVASDRSTPEAKAKALAEIRRGDAVGAPMSPDLLLKAASLAGTNALRNVHGPLIGKGITILRGSDGVESFQIVPGQGTGDAVQETIRKTYEDGVRSVLRLVVDPVTGRPNPAYEAVVESFAMGFNPKAAPPASDKDTPPKKTPTRGSMPRPEAATTPAEAARPAQIAPTGTPSIDDLVNQYRTR